jgi:hypothetical protein
MGNCSSERTLGACGDSSPLFLDATHCGESPTADESAVWSFYIPAGFRLCQRRQGGARIVKFFSAGRKRADSHLDNMLAYVLA